MNKAQLFAMSIYVSGVLALSAEPQVSSEAMTEHPHNAPDLARFRLAMSERSSRSERRWVTSTTTTTTAENAKGQGAGRTRTVPAKAVALVTALAGDAKTFIYMKESHNNPAAVNGSGCVGLGQNCPDKHGNVAVVAACPNWRTDYACQDKWFTGYMVNRYGTWNKAKTFWLANGWW